MGLKVASNSDCISQEGQASLRQQSRRLSRRLDRRGIENPILDIELIHTNTGGVRIKLELQMEGSDYIHVAKAGTDEIGVIRFAIEALIKQCDRQELKTKNHVHHRIQKRKGRRLRLANAPTEQSILSSSMWKNLWPWLVRQSTGAVLELQSSGSINPGDLSPVDLAEEVILYYIEHSETPSDLHSTKAMLLKLLDQAVAEELAQLAKSSKFLNNDLAEKTVMEELELLGDDVMELCQSHVNDQHSSDGAIETNDDLHAYAHKQLKLILWSALSTLSASERHAYCSQVMDNENYKDIAITANTTESVVKKAFESAESKLHAFLDKRISGAKQPNWVALLYTSLGRQFSESLGHTPIPHHAGPETERNKMLSWLQS